MIGNIFILNNNFETVGIIDAYKSLIWANRYNDLGDCELYVPATEENINLLQLGYYIRRSNDEMVCRIRKIEVDTSPEDGNYLVVTGYDVKQWLDQRIVWNTIIVEGATLENFLQGLVVSSLVNPTNSNRKITDENNNLKLKVDSAIGLTPLFSGKISYENVGETVRSHCKEHNWGYRVVLKNDGIFYFQLYEGVNRSDTVIFADELENLSTTKCVFDSTEKKNVALIAGAGEGSRRTRVNIGDKKSVNRYELYVDAKDISKTIKWEELIALYPDTAHGGQGHIEQRQGNEILYEMNIIEVPIVDDEHEAWLEAYYPGGEVVIYDLRRYYRMENVSIAELPTLTPQNNTDVVLRDVIYSAYLFSNGETKLAEHPDKTTFEGKAIPDLQFMYKQDYFLGDLVKIRSTYGIAATARITEVIEVSDENGYSVEPKLEYNIS